MTFDEWWGTLTTREQARMVKDDVAEAWQAAFQDGYEKGIAAFHEAVKVEREECAKVCESMIDPVDDEWRNKRPDEAAEFDASDAGKQACAAAIRARSNA